MGIYTCEGKGLEIVVGSRYLVRLRLLKLRRWLDLDLTLGEYLLTELGGEVGTYWIDCLCFCQRGYINSSQDYEAAAAVVAA